MKDSPLYYSVGALLYCPADHRSVADHIIAGRFGSHFSLALCLEDTIRDGFVAQAEQQLCRTIQKICRARADSGFYLPKMFIRVRNAEQMMRLYRALGEQMAVITGFIIPKFSMDDADAYIDTISDINASSCRPVYMMPIYESSSILNLRTRYDVLYALKDKMSPIEELILNIRVGGNDLCHLFGFRRHSDTSIHEITPISHIFSDIVTVYGTDYVISGPVWEYYGGGQWEEGLRKEIADDRLCGFTGKTAIHPAQIPVINDAYAVEADDYRSARAILDWDPGSSSLVSADPRGMRMNECRTHTEWARKTILLAECYGIRAS